MRVLPPETGKEALDEVQSSQARAGHRQATRGGGVPGVGDGRRPGESEAAGARADPLPLAEPVGHMNAEEMKRLKAIEAENAQLKELVADLSLDKEILKEALEGKY